jgi:hypothetical protein
MSRYRILFAPALAIALVGAGLAGCGDDGPVVTGDESPALAPRSDGTDCVEFQGRRHCRLGGAKVVPREDGKVIEVTQLAAAEQDGLSILLPDVTNFAADGRIDGTAPGSVLNVRALNDGNTVGTMSLKRTEGGYVVSAAFTGDDNTGTYNVRLYNQEALVGTVSGLASGGDGLYLPRFVPIWRWWWWWWWWPSFWNVRQPSRLPDGPEVGACVWSIPFVAGDEVQVVADDGKPVVADRIELEEVVRRGGSYPYLTFNRIDYTTSGASMLLLGENIENRP